MKLFGRAVLLALFSLTATAQNDLPPMKRITGRHTPAYRAAKGFMRGVNIANYLEVPPGEHWSVPHTVVDLKQIRAEGFDHIRLPVGWHHYTGPGPDYKISDEIFAKADYMVTNATALGLNVIINLQHFNEFTTDPATNTAWFHAIWRQVAAHYARAPAGVAFELLNEPHDAATTAVMNPIYAEAIREIRRTNPHRTIFVGPGKWNSPNELPNLQLPDDDNIIVTLHCYDPMFFTHQGASWAGPDFQHVTGIHFPGPPIIPFEPDPNLQLKPWVLKTIQQYNTQPASNNPCSPRAFLSKIEKAKAWSEEYGRPVHFGEFGAFIKADQESRAHYYKAMREAFDAVGIGWAIWDWKSGFNYWDRKTQQPLPGMRQALFPGKAQTEIFSIGDKDFVLNGEPFQIRCGEMHFARIPREYWAQRLRMAHAMGLNTVCAYLFWNLHEPAPGKFDFFGNADIAEFCRLAQAEGLHVILRPGPYSCAEWDFGGLPWWLLKIPDIKVRTRDPRYLAACKKYLARVGRELAPLQITRGGPIIMVQVENEYGSFGSDKAYMGLIRDDIKSAGFDVPLFTCDGPKQLTNDTRDDLFCVVNVGRKPEKALQTLRQIRPGGPLMIGEYYPGWFDSWGQPHHTASTTNIVAELAWMLTHNVSFSIYMAHGGTTFGFDAGANFPPFSPQITSYDYDAPISEAGWATPKFYALRELFSKHLNPGETLPEVPPPNPTIQIAPIELNECAPLFDNLPPPKKVARPKPMEMFDQPRGAILYRTQLPAGNAAQLRITELHDYGLIFLDGKKIATLDRRLQQNSASLPARAASATLDLLVDSFGHINYGKNMGDWKGITDKVELETDTSTNVLTGWRVFNLPFDDQELGRLKFKAGATAAPAFFRGSFSLAQTGDTFLDLSSWSKGIVWVNGHNLGRYWDIGPQQTLYCPGPWLKTGRNEIVVFDSDDARHEPIAGRLEPILNKVK